MRADVVEPRAEADITSQRLPFLAPAGNVWRGFLGRISKLGHWAWPVTIAIALIYTACFASFIDRHTSLPFWDGYVYVQRTWVLAENLHNASFFERLNPALYFKGTHPERPPLLFAIAAIVLGRDPGNAGIAYVWLTVRVAIILLALYLLSRELGTARFVPAAALVIFGSPLMCNFFRLYLMDEPFAAFGLLAFTLILIDDRRQTTGSALAASLGILALFLVKPVAPAFVFPFCVIRAARALLPLRSNFKPQLPRLLFWGSPYLVLAIVMVALFYGTPYGPGIREQYRLGLAGYWNEDLSASETFELLGLVLPPWLLLGSVVLVRFARGFKHHFVLLYLAGGLLWWLLFSFYLTYAVQARLVGQAMPYVVTALVVWICHRPTPALIATAIAGFFFSYNTLVANGRMAPRYRGSTAAVLRFLSPLPHLQQPVPEVGLLPFAAQLEASVREDKSRLVYAVFGENYVTPNGINMALRINKRPPSAAVRPLPRGANEFDVAQFCQTRWFITKTRRQHIGGGPGMWTTVDSVHSLITDPESPLHPYFRKILESPVHPPDFEDTLVLWNLPSPPPSTAIAEALRWLKPRLGDDPRTAIIDSQLKTLAK